jgi:hypothetical protein
MLLDAVGGAGEQMRRVVFKRTQFRFGMTAIRFFRRHAIVLNSVGSCAEKRESPIIQPTWARALNTRTMSAMSAMSVIQGPLTVRARADLY